MRGRTKFGIRSKDWDSRGDLTVTKGHELVHVVGAMLHVVLDVGKKVVVSVAQRRVPAKYRWKGLVGREWSGERCEDNSEKRCYVNTGTVCACQSLGLQLRFDESW